MTAPGRLLGAAEMRRLAAELDLRPTKTLGQNFVHDANTVRRIVATARPAVRPTTCSRSGPGLGSLTLGLLEASAAVTAVEIDPRLAELLPRTVAAHAPDLAGPAAGDHRGRPRDRRRRSCRRPAGAGTGRSLTTGPPTALVANLPYNVAVPVLLHLLEELPTMRRVLVMVQAEVADRLAAGPGSRTYGAPSVKTAWYGTVRRAGSVGRTIFWPVPGVDSALVALDRHADTADSRRPGRGLRGDRRGLRPAPQDATGRAGRSGPDRRPTPRRCCCTAGIDPHRAVARCSTSTISSRSRPRGPSMRPMRESASRRIQLAWPAAVRVRAPGEDQPAPVGRRPASGRLPRPA